LKSEAGYRGTYLGFIINLLLLVFTLPQAVVQIIPPTNFNGLVEVLDLKGTVVYRSAFATDVISLSVESWSRGLYLVRLSAVNYTEVLKLIVE